MFSILDVQFKKVAPYLFLLRMAIIAIATGLWVLSLALPALTVIHRRDVTSTLPGIMVFFLGWMGIDQGHVGWYANLVAPIALILLLFGQEIVATPFAILALGLALSSFTMSFNPVFFYDGDKLLDSYNLGFWVWLSSDGVLFAGCLLTTTLQLLRLAAKAGWVNLTDTTGHPRPTDGYVSGLPKGNCLLHQRQ